MIILLFYAKFVYGLLRIFTFGFKHYRWEIWVIGGIGEVLSFKTDCATTGECSSILTLVAISPIVCIDLYTWLCCINLHSTTAHGFNDFCSKTKLSFFFLIKNKAMVVASSIPDLLVIGVYVLANNFG